MQLKLARKVISEGGKEFNDRMVEQKLLVKKPYLIDNSLLYNDKTIIIESIYINAYYCSIFYKMSQLP